MSQENVEIVRNQFGATNEGDFARVVRYWFRSFERGYRFNLEEARDLGDAVLVVAKHQGRGRASGAEVQVRMAYLYRVRDGKVARIELYPGRAEALEAVGLSEQDAHADS